MQKKAYVVWYGATLKCDTCEVGGVHSNQHLLRTFKVRDVQPEISPQNFSRSLSSGSKLSKVICVKLVSLTNLKPKLWNQSLEPLGYMLSASKLSLSPSDSLGS